MKYQSVFVCIVCLFIIILGGRQVWSQETKTEDSKATIFFYRYNQFVGWTLDPMVYCKEKELAKMDNGSFFKVKLDPGKHTFQSSDKQSGLELNVKPGEEYYIRVEIAQGFWKFHGRLVLVQKEQGAFEIKKLKPLNPKKVKDKSKVVIDEEPAKS